MGPVGSGFLHPINVRFPHAVLPFRCRGILNLIRSMEVMVHDAVLGHWADVRARIPPALNQGS